MVDKMDRQIHASVSLLFWRHYRSPILQLTHSEGLLAGNPGAAAPPRFYTHPSSHLAVV